VVKTKEIGRFPFERSELANSAVRMIGEGATSMMLGLNSAGVICV
jgi:hypothetical protein